MVKYSYISPESILENHKFRGMLLTSTYKRKLVAIVVDEAHCIKTWGDRFRQAFSKLGDLRSIVPSGINIMALTATATLNTFHVIKQKLSLDEPVLLSISPVRDNITYRVAPKLDINSFCSTICADLKSKRKTYPKSVIFVRTYSDCCTLYLAIRKIMGQVILEPLDAPELSEFLLVDVFTSVSTPGKKEEMICSFKAENSTLRVIIATSAFGMGVDCPNIRKIYHWGSPSDIEQYVQETGRAGRDGENATATIFEGRVGRHTSREMKNYLDNSTICRRRLLFQEFLSYSEKDITVTGINCCDICEVNIE